MAGLSPPRPPPPAAAGQWQEDFDASPSPPPPPAPAAAPGGWQRRSLPDLGALGGLGPAAPASPAAPAPPGHARSRSWAEDFDSHGANAPVVVRAPVAGVGTGGAGPPAPLDLGLLQPAGETRHRRDRSASGGEWGELAAVRLGSGHVTPASLAPAHLADAFALEMTLQAGAKHEREVPGDAGHGEAHGGQPAAEPGRRPPEAPPPADPFGALGVAAEMAEGVLTGGVAAPGEVSDRAVLDHLDRLGNGSLQHGGGPDLIELGPPAGGAGPAGPPEGDRRPAPWEPFEAGGGAAAGGGSGVERALHVDFPGLVAAPEGRTAPPREALAVPPVVDELGARRAGRAPGEPEFDLIPAAEIHVTRRIGRGSYGDVVHATWKGTDVAVKVLNRLEVAKAVDDFKREVALLLRLRHPNVVLFMGANLAGPDMCIVMEYCAQGSLYQVLRDPAREKPDSAAVLR